MLRMEINLGKLTAQLRYLVLDAGSAHKSSAAEYLISRKFDALKNLAVAFLKCRLYRVPVYRITYRSLTPFAPYRHFYRGPVGVSPPTEAQRRPSRIAMTALSYFTTPLR